MRIALADDEADILKHMSYVVTAAGHEVDCFSNGADLVNALTRDTYDLALIDWNMPRKTGLEVVEWATAALPSPPPIILLTSRQDKDDIVRGLEAGACDYIIKPESDAVITARIEAAVRRNSPIEKPRYTDYRDYRLDRLDRSISFRQEPVQLTSKEFELAALLFENLNRPLSRSYLFSHVWGVQTDLETRTIDMHISRLRTKLSLKPENGYTIRTVFGFGYRMDQYDEPAS